MIFTLLVMSLAQKESVRRWALGRKGFNAVVRFLIGQAPAALGKPYRSG
jgi:hypothetical protein